MAKGKGSGGGPRPKAGKFPARWVLALAVLCAAAYAALVFVEHRAVPDAGVAQTRNDERETRSAERQNRSEIRVPSSAEAPAYHEPVREPQPDAPAPEWAALRTYPVRMKGEPAKMAIILDDVGYDAAAVERAMALKIPLTFSVLPNAPHGEELARRIYRAGFEVWLHLPMEPEGAANPGADAILSSMSKAETTGLMLDHLKAIPYIRGVNNHMGSRATARRGLMEWALAPVRDRGLYFVDSKTTPKTAAFAVAKELGIPCSIRDVFLDDTPDAAHTLEHLKKLEAKAEEQGTAVGIGHFYSSTLDALERHFAAPRRKASGPELVFASEIVELESIPLEP